MRKDTVRRDTKARSEGCGLLAGRNGKVGGETRESDRPKYRPIGSGAE